MEDKFKNIKSYIDDVMYDKTNNTLGDWISDYGGVVNENYTITFGSHFALQKMLDRRDKEVIRIALSHAINSHDELVENMQHYKQEAEQWEVRATNEASRAQDLQAEVERLRESLKWAVGNLMFENAFEWSDDENADAHYAALRLLGVEVEE